MSVLRRDDPRIPKENIAAFEFYWKTEKDVYKAYSNGEISREAAMAKTISLVEEYGPKIWGQDRSSLVSSTQAEYPRQLYWDESKETKEFIKSQAMQLFNYREAKGSQKSKSSGGKRKSDLLARGASKRARQISPPETETFRDDETCSIVSEYSPSIPPTKPIVRERPQPAKIATRKLIVKLQYRGCVRCNQQEVACNQGQPCIRCLSADKRCTYPQLETRQRASTSPLSIDEEMFHYTQAQVCTGSSLPKPHLKQPQRISAFTIFQDSPDASIKLSSTVIFMRLENTEYSLPRMELGTCPQIVDFWGKISSHAQPPKKSIQQIAVSLPKDIGRLPKYVLQIKAGDQRAFDELLDVIANAVVEPGPTVYTPFVLTATIAVKPVQNTS